MVNIPASIVSGWISLRRRDYLGVALSALELIPIEGEFAAVIKLARGAANAHHLVNRGALPAIAACGIPENRRAAPQTKARSRWRVDCMP